jgi:uncharacterized membrane protein (UPF0182 family)
LEPADRPVSTVLGFFCSLATFLLFAACLYYQVRWTPLDPLGFFGVLITALGLSLIAYLVLGLAVAVVMSVEVRRRTRRIDAIMDGVMDRAEARMRAERDARGR